MNKLITTCIALFKVYIHQLYLKLLLYWTKTQRNNTTQSIQKYLPSSTRSVARLKPGYDISKDPWSEY